MSAFLRKYGTGTGADVIVPMIKRGVVDFAVTGDWTPATGDVKVSIDGGTPANIGTLPVINGTYGWKFVFADAELQGKSIRVTVVDSATKAVEDQMFIVETYGHASAMYKPDFSDSVRLGMTALPNAAADAAGGLPISDAGGLDLDTLNSNVAAVLADTGTDGVVVAAGSKSGYALSSTGMDAVTLPANIITASSLAANAVTAAKIASDAITAIQSGLGTAANQATIAGYIDTEIASIISSLSALSTALSTAQADLDLLTGADGATLATSQPNYAPATAAQATAIETDTQDIQSRIPAALVNSRMDATVDGTGMEAGAVTAIWTTALTEAYRSTGAAGTAAQLLHEILQNLTEFDITSTTKTVKKFDGSTTAKTYTLDDATTPTSITETT